MKALLRHNIVRLSHTSTFSAAVGWMERFARNRRGLLWALTYHRIDDPDASPGLDPDLISATPEQFRRQVEYLAKHCQVVSMAAVLAALKSQQPLPPRAVLLTFDDATRDFAQHAWPVLRRLDLPATLFVPTAFPDQPSRTFWWDRLQTTLLNAAPRGEIETPLGRLPVKTANDRDATRRRLKAYIKSLPHEEAMEAVERFTQSANSDQQSGENGQNSNAVLGWDDLQRLHDDGLTLAPHTQTHPLMDRISLAKAQAEAVGSLEDLRRRIGPQIPPVFAYPSGSVNDDVARMMKEAGFQAAFSTRRGINRLNRLDPQRMCRINIGRGTSLPLLRAQLLPCSAWATRFFP